MKTANQKPLCFVMMPFGEKKDSNGREINFKDIYELLIKPAILNAGMEPVIANEEIVGGSVHKSIYERILLCDYAIVDMTTVNANVFYEYGLRHAARRRHTLPIIASGCKFPFDVTNLRAIVYKSLNKDGKLEAGKLQEDINKITNALIEAKNNTDITDSPLFQYFTDLKPYSLPVNQAETFKDVIKVLNNNIDKVQEFVNNKDSDGLKKFEDSIDIANTNHDLLYELLIAYRSLKAWENMINLIERFSGNIKESLFVQQQYAFALNRNGETDRAITVLEKLIENYGENSETLGILGRAYKEKWEKEVNPAEKKAWLDKAIEIYKKGFDADIRDYYPGINALTLMSADDKYKDEFEKLMPVVTYAAKLKIESKNPNYWDWATILELEVLNKNEKAANEALIKALSLAKESWMKESTQKNLQIIKEIWDVKGEETSWLQGIINSLWSRN